MYLSKHQGGNAISTADHFDPNEAKKWKRDILEAYLGVALKRLFATGPEAFEEIYQRLEQFTRSLAATQPACSPAENFAPSPVPDPNPRDAPASGTSGNGEGAATLAEGVQALPSAVVETVTSLALAIDAKDHYTQGHSQKVSTYAVLLAEALSLDEAVVEEVRLAGVLHDVGK